MLIRRLLIRKALRNCEQFCYCREPRLAAGCNLQMSAARFLQIAANGSFAFLGKPMISESNDWH
jgi:hypothetical protein